MPTWERTRPQATTNRSVGLATLGYVTVGINIVLACVSFIIAVPRAPLASRRRKVRYRYLSLTLMSMTGVPVAVVSFL